MTNLEEFILRHQSQFINHFLPNYCVSLARVTHLIDEEKIQVVVRVKLSYEVSTKPKGFLIPVKKIQSWIDNFNLYNFVYEKNC